VRYNDRVKRSASARTSDRVTDVAFAVVGCVCAVLTVGGCAHRVRVESNVPDAVVRVDGEPVGRVGDGASFVERWGFDVVYDVDVAAPGHCVERRLLRPSVTEPAVAVPALLGSCGGCVAGGCVMPVAALSSTEELGFYTWSGLSVLTLAAAGGACALAFGGGERLPDVVTIELERDVGAGVDGDLPPPPTDVDDPAPLPPPVDVAPPTSAGASARSQATPNAGAGTLRW
jgi:hypothetical protein